MKKHSSFTDSQLIDGINNAINEIQQRNFQNLFYAKYVNYVYKAAIKKCRNFRDSEDLAKDVTQETFKIIFKLIIGFNFNSNVPETDHPYILKAWLGRIANNCFKKIYASKINGILVECNSVEMDDVICPMCGEFLDEVKKDTFSCRKKHYIVKRGNLKQAQPLSNTEFADDFFQSLYLESDIEVPNEYRLKLQEAMIKLTDKQKHILLAFANEGCLNTKHHISDATLKELCTIYETTSDNIKHIKNRALDKIKSICFPKS